MQSISVKRFGAMIIHSTVNFSKLYEIQYLTNLSVKMSFRENMLRNIRPKEVSIPSG